MERSTLPDPGGIADLGHDARLVVDLLHHDHQEGSVHWVLEFTGSHPETVSIRTAGPRVVPRQRSAELAAEDLRRLDRMFRELARWGPGESSYCDVRLRRFRGEELVTEETRRGVMPLPSADCELLMGLCRTLHPEYEAPKSGARAAKALAMVVRGPVRLFSLLRKVLGLTGGAVRSRQGS